MENIVSVLLRKKITERPIIMEIKAPRAASNSEYLSWNFAFIK
jgi:hypothetical protein